MTDTATGNDSSTETAERPFFVREFAADLVESDGRTLEGLCVPYNTPTTVSDGGPAYREMFVKGAFQRAVKAPNRVWLNFEHHQGMPNVLGSGVAFEERDDGLYGTLRIDDGADGEKALRLYRSRVLESLSVEFKQMGKPTIRDGVVVRDNVHLNAVALCRQGAYDNAKVLAVRTEPVIDEALMPLELPDSTIEVLKRIGKLPARLQAHPDEADTPAQAGTPQSGTRLSDTTHSEGEDNGGNPE